MQSSTIDFDSTLDCGTDRPSLLATRSSRGMPADKAPRLSAGRRYDIVPETLQRCSHAVAGCRFLGDQTDHGNTFDRLEQGTDFVFGRVRGTSAISFKATTPTSHRAASWGGAPLNRPGYRPLSSPRPSSTAAKTKRTLGRTSVRRAVPDANNCVGLKSDLRPPFFGKVPVRRAFFA